MKKNKIPKFVADVTFRKFAQSVDERFVQVDQRFDRLDATVNRIAVTVVKHESDIQDIRTTMMTRDMGQEILKQLGDFAARYEESERAARIHLNQLMDYRPVLDNHEMRLGALEERISPKL